MKLLNEHEVADRLGCTVACLRRWRREKRGIPFVRISRLVKYRDEDVESFILNNIQDISEPLMTQQGHKRYPLTSITNKIS